ncbi:restriction endonuclease subunit S [Clostridium sp. ZS1]|uniref:restriction endonuclease subunit S n=1 Tax=Clostridium sp. ZS1 TaxID=2949989 RepID=UPI00207AA247|nr:restriction endonuclease subunit S [Clostridium sp. ZS1]
MAKKKLTLEEKMEEAIVKDAPYDVPRNWIWTKLNVVCDVRDGTHDSPTYIDEGVPLITSKNLKNGEIVFENVNYISEEDYELISKRSKVDEGDILFAMIGTIGNPVLVTNMFTEFSIKNVALFKSRNIISDKFMYYYVQSFMYMKQLEKNLKGSTQKFIALGKLRESYVALPPLKEQQRIVDIIESLFEKLDKANELIEEARVGFEKRKSVILEKAFRGELTENWRKDTNIHNAEEIMFEELFSFIGGGTPSKAKKEYWNGEINWASVKDIKNNYLYETIDKITEEGAKNSSTNIAKNGEIILVTRISPGKVTISQKDIAINQDLKIVRPKMNRIDHKYIYYLFLYKEKELISKSQGTTVKGITINELNKIKISLPTLEEQKEIVRILDKLLEDESKIEQLTALEDQIELIKKSILAKAFRGEVGTNDSNEESALELLKEILRKNNT